MTDKPLFDEISTTADGRDITRGFVDPLMLQPTNDKLLRMRGNGDYRIYREVLRDDQVGSCFQQRRLAVRSKEIQVIPGGDSRIDKKAADFIRETVSNTNFDGATDKMMYAIFYGFGVAEYMWATDGGQITLDTIKVRERQRFGFDGAGRLRLKTFADPNGELMPDKKFWCFVTGADNDDDLYGLGLAHWLYWPTFFKRGGLRSWLRFLDKFGMPTAHGKYSPGASPQEKTKLLQALQAIATDSGIITPDGMTVELLEMARSGTADYSVLYNKMDDAITKIIMGQIASTQGAPGRLGEEKLQAEVRSDLIKADADLLSETFNRTAVQWLTDWNFAGAAYPKVWRNVEEEEDLTAHAKRDQIVYSMGYKPTLQHIQQTYGGEWEAAPPPPLLPPSESAQFAAPASVPATPAAPSDLIADQLVRDAAPVVQGWLEKVQQVLDAASSLDEAKAMLFDAFGDLPTDELAQKIGDALLAAHAAGRYDAEQQSGG